MSKIEYELKAIMYSVYDIPHRRCSISGNSIQIQKGLLKHIHIYSNLTQYDSTKMITNIKYLI